MRMREGGGREGGGGKRDGDDRIKKKESLFSEEIVRADT